MQRPHEQGVRGGGHAHPHLRAVAEQQGLPVAGFGRHPHRELGGQLEQRGGPRQLRRGERPRPPQPHLRRPDPQRVDVSGGALGRGVDQPRAQHRGHRARRAARFGDDHAGQRERRGGRVGQLHRVRAHQQRAGDARAADLVDERGRVARGRHPHEQLVGHRAVVGGLAHHVQRDDVAAGAADGRGELAQPARPVLELHVHPPQHHKSSVTVRRRALAHAGWG